MVDDCTYCIKIFWILIIDTLYCIDIFCTDTFMCTCVCVNRFQAGVIENRVMHVNGLYVVHNELYQGKLRN